MPCTMAAKGRRNYCLSKCQQCHLQPLLNVTFTLKHRRPVYRALMASCWAPALETVLLSGQRQDYPSVSAGFSTHAIVVFVVLLLFGRHVGSSQKQPPLVSCLTIKIFVLSRSKNTERNNRVCSEKAFRKHTGSWGTFKQMSLSTWAFTGFGY